MGMYGDRRCGGFMGLKRYMRARGNVRFWVLEFFARWMYLGIMCVTKGVTKLLGKIFWLYLGIMRVTKGVTKSTWWYNNWVDFDD